MHNDIEFYLILAKDKKGYSLTILFIRNEREWVVTPCQ